MNARKRYESYQRLAAQLDVHAQNRGAARDAAADAIRDLLAEVERLTAERDALAGQLATITADRDDARMELAELGTVRDQLAVSEDQLRQANEAYYFGR